MKLNIRAIVNFAVMLFAVLGSIFSVMNGSIAKLWIVFGTWCALFIVCYLIGGNKNIEKNIFPNICAVISLFLFTLSVTDMVETSFSNFFAALILVTMILIVFVVLCKWDNSRVAYGVFVSIYLIYLQYFISKFFANEKHYGVIIYATGLISILYFEYRKREGDNGKLILQIVGILFMWKGIGVFGEEYEFLIPLVILIPFLVFGFIRCNRMICYVGLYITWVYMDFSTVVIFAKFVTLLLIFILVHILMRRHEPSPEIETVVYIVEVVGMIKIMHPIIEICVGNHEIAKALSFFVITVFSVIGRYLNVKRDKVVTAYEIANVLLVGWGLMLLLSHTIQMAKNMQYLMAMSCSLISLFLILNIYIKKLYNRRKKV
ncbi:MAG: hypothetical protein J6L69_04140 [Lachnospiraceae bacterium]|nr:hypothetical protein [Lachnospiraceae bacterium]